TDENGIGDEYPEVDESMVSEYKKTQETINYEINQLNETIKRAPYRLRGITASVLINTNGLGDTDQNAAEVQALVGGALGLQPSAYNGNVVVSYLPMRGIERDKATQLEWEETKKREEMYALIQTLVLYGIIGICVILLILRTFAFLKPKPMEIPADILAGDVDDYEDLLEAAAANMELEVIKTPSRERIEEFVDSNPEAVASMLRSWLQEDDDRSW
ncbi:MAG: hypothetical protein LBH95_04555, partial [Oscillospiraceae bacterium]|nr:hypothetical protein [Oscillospiraceae bacterium]